MRLNQLTGSTSEVRDGAILVIPGLHELRRYSLLDQVYRPTRSAKADGEALNYSETRRQIAFLADDGRRRTRQSAEFR